MSFSYEPKNFDHFFVLHKKNNIENDKWTCYKNTVSFVTHSPKYIEKGRKPTTTGVESRFKKMLGRGVVEWHLHAWHATDDFAPLQHEALEAAKRAGNVDIKSLLLTVQASCDYIQTIEVSCLYFSIFLVLIFFSLFKLFFGLLLQVYVDC